MRYLIFALALSLGPISASAQENSTEFWSFLGTPNEIQSKMILDAIITDDFDVLMSLIEDLNKSEATMDVMIDSFLKVMKSDSIRRNFLRTLENKTITHPRYQRVGFPSGVLGCGAILITTFSFYGVIYSELDTLSGERKELVRKNYMNALFTSLGLSVIGCFNDYRRIKIFGSEYLRELRKFQDGKKFLKQFKELIEQAMLNKDIEALVRKNAYEIYAVNENAKILLENKVAAIDRRIEKSKAIQNTKSVKTKLYSILLNRDIKTAADDFHEKIHSIRIEHQLGLLENYEQSEFLKSSSGLKFKLDLLSEFQEGMESLAETFSINEPHYHLYRTLLDDQLENNLPAKKNLILKLRNGCLASLGIIVTLRSYLVSVQNKDTEVDELNSFLQQIELPVQVGGFLNCTLTTVFGAINFKKLSKQIHFAFIRDSEWLEMKRAISSLSISETTSEETNYFSVLKKVNDRLRESSQRSICYTHITKFF